MIKIKMLKERFVPVLNVMGKADEVLKVNNNVGHELVEEGDAEYFDPELMAEMMKRATKGETAAYKPPEDAMMSTPKPEKMWEDSSIWDKSKKKKSKKGK